MKRFLRQQLQDFLEAVDAALDHAVEVVVIGGTLRGETTRRRLDLRSWEAGQDVLREWGSRGPKAVAREKVGAAVRAGERPLQDATATQPQSGAR